MRSKKIAVLFRLRLHIKPHLKRSHQERKIAENVFRLEIQNEIDGFTAPNPANIKLTTLGDLIVLFEIS